MVCLENSGSVMRSGICSLLVKDEVCTGHSDARPWSVIKVGLKISRSENCSQPLRANAAGFGSQGNAERFRDFRDGVKAWLCAGGRGFVEAFPPKPGIFGKLGHVPGFCNVSECGQEYVGVIVKKGSPCGHMTAFDL